MDHKNWYLRELFESYQKTVKMKPEPETIDPDMVIQVFRHLTPRMQFNLYSRK